MNFCFNFEAPKGVKNDDLLLLLSCSTFEEGFVRKKMKMIKNPSSAFSLKSLIKISSFPFSSLKLFFFLTVKFFTPSSRQFFFVRRDQPLVHVRRLTVGDNLYEERVKSLG